MSAIELIILILLMIFIGWVDGSITFKTEIRPPDEAPGVKKLRKSKR